MADSKQENNNLPPVNGQNTTQSPIAAPTATPAKPITEVEISKGEKTYNWVVYSGLNYWVNLIGSMFIADYLTHDGSSGKKYLNKSIEYLTKGVEKAGLSLKSSYHFAKVSLETLSLTSGGWILLVPMKWMEDRKRNIVHWLNDHMGVDQTAPDGHKLKADEIYIEKEQPHQSWLNVIVRRIYATAAVVGSGLLIDKAFADHSKKKTTTYTVEGREPWVEERQFGGKERVTEFVTNYVRKGLEIGGETLKKDSVAERWIKLLALDSVFTKITAVIMYVTNGAKKEKLPDEIATVAYCPPAVAVVPPEAAPNEAPVIAPVKRQLSHAASARRNASPERFASHVQKLAAEPERTLQPNV